MGRKKTRARRRGAVSSGDDEEDEVVTEAGGAEQGSEGEDQESVPDLVGALEEESDPELEEVLEEVENFVNAVLEIDDKEKEDVNEVDRINGGGEGDANLCGDGVDGGNKDGTEVKNMNPSGEFPAEEKNSDASCLNSPLGSAAVSGTKLDAAVTEDNLVDTKEENSVEGEPSSASKLQEIISDEPLSDVVEVEVSKEGKDDSEHHGSNDIVKVNSNVVIVKDKDDGKEESKEGRDDSEHNDNADIIEGNKAPSSDVIPGCARSVGVADTPVNQRERVLLQVKTVCLQRLPKLWDVEKITETCKQYGLITRVELFRNFRKKGNDVGFVAFATRESAVACVEGINKAQFGEAKVKADIMRPLVGRRQRKDAHKGFKVKEMLRRAPGLNINSHALLEVPQREVKFNGQVVINKSDMTGDSRMENAEGDHQILSVKRNTEQGGTSKSQKGVFKTRDDGMPPKSGEKRRRRRRERRRKRGGHQDYNSRPSNKQSGNLQVHPRDSLRSSRRKPNFKRKPAHSAGSAAYRIPYAEKHAASSSSRSGYAGNSNPRSKRPATYMEPHGRYLEPRRKKDGNHRNHTRHIEPSLRHHHHQERIHSTYLEPPFRHGVPLANYLQPLHAQDSLPHAGLMETRRTGPYNGIGEQGSAYWGVNPFPPTYAPNYSNYSSYQGSSSGSGYNPTTEAYYQPTRPRY